MSMCSENDTIKIAAFYKCVNSVGTVWYGMVWVDRCRMLGKCDSIAGQRTTGTEKKKPPTATTSKNKTNKLKFYWHFPRVIYGARFILLTHSFAIHVYASNSF